MQLNVLLMLAIWTGRRLAISPNEKSIVFIMGKGGIKRLDLDAKGKTPKFTEMTGRGYMHAPLQEACALTLPLGRKPVPACISLHRASSTSTHADALHLPQAICRLASPRSRARSSALDSGPMAATWPWALTAASYTCTSGRPLSSSSASGSGGIGVYSKMYACSACSPTCRVLLNVLNGNIV